MTQFMAYHANHEEGMQLLSVESVSVIICLLSATEYGIHRRVK